MSNTQYIGVTDIPNRSWLEELLLDFIFAGGRRVGKKLHAGVMMSYKTLNRLPTKWADAWPKNEEVASTFFSHPSLLNTLHYADYEDKTILGDLVRAVQLGGRHLNAIQLDMVWPEPQLLESLKDLDPNLHIILQVGGIAIESADNSVDKVVQILSGYRKTIDAVLLDKSMGRGLGMDAKFLRPFVAELHAYWPELGITVAGGLGPKSLNLVEPLIAEFPFLSIDAQGQLRPTGNALDPINYDLASSYIREAVKLFRGHHDSGTAQTVHRT